MYLLPYINKSPKLSPSLPLFSSLFLTDRPPPPHPPHTHPTHTHRRHSHKTAARPPSPPPSKTSSLPPPPPPSSSSSSSPPPSAPPSGRHAATTAAAAPAPPPPPAARLLPCPLSSWEAAAVGPWGGALAAAPARAGGAVGAWEIRVRRRMRGCTRMRGGRRGRIGRRMMGGWMRGWVAGWRCGGRGGGGGGRVVWCEVREGWMYAMLVFWCCCEIGLVDE